MFIRKTPCNTGTGCICACFPGKCPCGGFPVPNFLSIDLRVSRGSRTMVYRIWSSSVVPLTFPGHSLVSSHGEDPLTPPDKLREPIFFAWNGDLATKRSTSWLWKLSGSCRCWQELFHFSALLTFFLLMNLLTSLALISTKLRRFFLLYSSSSVLWTDFLSLMTSTSLLIPKTLLFWSDVFCQID